MTPMNAALPAPEESPAERPAWPGALAPVLDVFLRVLVVGSALVAVFAAVTSPTRTVVAAVVNGVVDLLMWRRLRRGRARGVGLVVLITLLAVTFPLMVRGRGIHDVATLVLPLVLIVAALLERRWQTALVTIMALGGAWAIWQTERMGLWSSRTTPAAGWDDIVILTILLLIACVLMRAVVERLNSALEQARASAHDYRDAVQARQRLEDELRQSEKLRALGQLAGGVAHDFNNQLTGILANAELLAREAGLRPALAEPVDAIVRCATRSADLTRQLLAFARKARPRRERVDLRLLTGEVTALIRRALHPGTELVVEAEDDGLAVTGDPSLLGSALLNVGLNARDALPDGGRLHFRLARAEIPLGRAIALQITAGSYVHVSVSDTGVGMDGTTLARVFDPFFTTKENGNGMGLAATYGTVKGHGGAITVSSTPGQGTTFDIYLPRDETGEAVPEAVPGETSSAKGARILVIDDQPEVGTATARMLAALGHRPTLQTDAQAALAFFAEHPQEFALAVVDRVMPGLGGDQMVDRLRAHTPDLPVLLVSGYSEAEAPPAGGKVVFLPKPFGLHALDQAVSAALSARAPRERAPSG